MMKRHLLSLFAVLMVCPVVGFAGEGEKNKLPAGTPHTGRLVSVGKD